ncbi:MULTISPECIES: hypothetical protein [Burkholderia cepacia complex]|uniref:hypothetical protein n=1 Tax=Burkholderia cepacia complex TaxID=87882 RepID=UPI0012EEB68B|nr:MULTISPECIES: hypothetical protein [Burkholderia cepacia complex]
MPSNAPGERENASKQRTWWRTDLTVAAMEAGRCARTGDVVRLLPAPSHAVVMCGRPLFSSGFCKKARARLERGVTPRLAKETDGLLLSLAPRTLEFSIRRHLCGRFAVDDKYCNQRNV